MEEETPSSLQRAQNRESNTLGSHARSEASRHSDIDLIFIKNTSLGFFDRYEGVLAAFSQVLPEWDVDILIYTPKELEEISQRHFIRQALKEGKILYESV